MFMPGLGSDALGWHVHLDFARSVRALGHDFEILTTASSRRGTGASSESLTMLPVPGNGWSTLGRLAAPLLRTRSVVPMAAALSRYLRRHGSSVDLLHIEVTYPHGVSAALARRLSGWSGPIVLTPMGEDTLVVDSASYGFRRYACPRALISWTLRQADLIRCISPMFEERLAVLAPERPRRLMPLNVSTETASAATESESARVARRTRARARLDARCGSHGRPVVLALGRLHPFKGLDVLVRAMAWVPEALLVIVGPSLVVRPDGDVATQLLSLAETLGLGDRVKWMGQASPAQATDWLAGADVVAVPSHLESLNKVCVEAAAVGTPFVVTESTGISAWVDGEGVGLVVPPADPAALASALREVVSGGWRSDRRRLSEFVQPFRPETVARQLVGVYEDVLAGSGAGVRKDDGETH